MTVSADTRELEEKVRRMYRAVATEPAGRHHFELRRPLAERGLGMDVVFAATQRTGPERTSAAVSAPSGHQPAIA